MYIKLVKSRTSTNIQVYLAESYRIGQKVSSRNIKRYGVLQELEKDDPNILEKLKQEAKELTESNKLENIISIELNLNKKIKESTSIKNIGSEYLNNVIDSLELRELLLSLTKKDKIKYDIYKTLKFLIIMRILYPGSKLDNHNNLGKLWREYDISLADIYRSLNYYDKHKDKIIKHLDSHMIKNHQRDKTLVYYDVTNYYFESNETSELREIGPSKENVKHPIVTMGLYMDSNNYPISYDLFKGNTHDSKTLIPSFEKVRDSLGINKCIVVGDKGINGGNNIKHIIESGNGYIFSSKIRGSSKKMIDIALDHKGYQMIGDDFKYKKIELTRKVLYSNEMGRAKSIKVTENVVIFYSKNYDLKAKHERDKVLEKLETYIKKPNNLKQKTKQGKFKYLKQQESNKETGELVATNLTLSIDQEKVKTDELLDGYYLIASSELDLSALDIINKYRGLWQIEKSFRIIKSDLEGRPIYLSTDEHIKGHFLTCFMALLVSRIIENKLLGKYSVDKISKSLREMNVIELEQEIFKVIKTDKTQKDIQSAYGAYIDTAYIKKEKLLKLLKKIN